jgi:4-amino-4-deoxy-L-arabinose transferase-like glycosyltransferase
MTKAEERFSLHWGILSIFGTTPLESDTWGAFTDQAPYLSLGETPFVNPPLPMWGTVAWVKVMGETLPSSRFLSCVLALLSLIAMYFIAGKLGTSNHAMYASGFLAGSLIWNDIARHASPEIWGITFLLISIACILPLLKYTLHSLISRILVSIGLTIALCCLILSSFTYSLLFMSFVVLYGILSRPTAQQVKFIIPSIIIGFLIGYAWFLKMDLPYMSQMIDTLKQAHYIPSSMDFQTFIIDGALMPFFIVGFISGIQSLIRIKDMQKGISFMMACGWLFLTYAFTGFSFGILPPFILIALHGIGSFHVFVSSKRVQWILISISFVLAAFGIAPRMVEGLALMMTQQDVTVYGIIPLIAILLIFISAFILKSDTLNHLVYTAMHKIILALVIASMIKVAFANLLGKTRISPDALVYLQQKTMIVDSLSDKDATT